MKADPNGGRAGLLQGVAGILRQRWQRQVRKWRAFFRVTRRLAPYARKRARRLTLALACACGYMLLRLIEPWTLKLIFDNVLLGDPLPSVLAAVERYTGGSRIALLNILVAAIVLLAVVRGVLYYYQKLHGALVGQGMVADLRLDLYSHLQRLSFSFHDRRRTGDLLLRLTSDIRVIRDIFLSMPLSSVGELLMIVGMASVMFLMDWRLTLISLTTIPGLVLLVRRYRRPMKRAMRKQRQREGQLATLASEALGAIKVVQGYRRERYEVGRFGSQNKRTLRSGLKAARLEARLRWATEMSLAIVTAIVLAVAIRRVLAGSLSPGDLLVFFSYLRTFNRPLRRISKLAERAARGTAAGERVLEMLEMEPTVRDRRRAIDAGRLRGEICYKDVSFAYRKSDPRVLSDVQLEIRPGERVAIVGPTGSGKTSLVSLLPRFYEVSSGTVTIDGRDVRDLTLASLRRNISLVFQEPVLFAASVAENIGYGKPDATREEVIRAAELVGIHPIVAGLYEGYDTVIGERGGTLSGGQRQCVAIARAMIKDAPIVILDEPTTGLDGQSSALVLEALRRLMQGRTVLMITHQLHTVPEADRVVVIENGRIVEEGTPAELLSHGGLFARLHRLQTGMLSA
ncbi:MAG: ABC transporter ATP-binding protein [Gemmatimonadetes bacterium]|uniref:ABC transporter ATP-binding protein n=1 Tax=Candidatus Kutchimonas denitrificans TaxID=3056748 RepID=A0AAE5C9R1_9BACT|nr:ABC transporter ATP-binding protein [Gemmatimonadota bacterium]NIR75751.1 ABC transporter ATP-binding protein [Candidatus Kutchimonas denitrificans]NIS00364.1 ABC transporter ATP-binding protein [Gemmatimonadota bacterium]NIT66023.1 ABC transporter ATP-binding protein [Gemmatimonadota bacterium]NIU53727.1 ATP-binding cassette domain-containing protein [Gemmatimonadota bacterium]